MTTNDVVDRFQDVMCDMIDEGVSPDTITEALARLGFGDYRQADLPWALRLFGDLK
ncbi:MAG: hypothetical protein ABWY20_18970 [Mycobacterium sp.]